MSQKYEIDIVPYLKQKFVRLKATQLDTFSLPLAVPRNCKVIQTRSLIKAKLYQAVVISDWFCKHSWTV